MQTADESPNSVSAAEVARHVEYGIEGLSAYLSYKSIHRRR